MKQWKVVIGLLLVFILGALAGSLGTGMVLKRHHPFFGGKPEDRKVFIMKRLTRRLDLSEEQKVRIGAIVERVQSETFRQIREGRQRMRQQLQKGFAEIRKELTPEQQRRFDEMKAERERRRKERGRRFHGPWPPPPHEPVPSGPDEGS
jgi:Spy/CpxP family protein refolding chaperone